MAAKDTSGIERITYCLKRKPVITTLVNEGDLEEILHTTSHIVCVLKADVFTLGRIVHEIREAGKLSFIHFDLMEGLGKDKVGVAYLAKTIGADGVITTKSFIISEAQKLGLITVQRLFVFDSVSLDNGIKMAKSANPDAIEVLPGMVCSKIMSRIRKETDIPVIAGGLMVDMDDLHAAINSGAIGISTSSKELWRWQDNTQ